MRDIHPTSSGHIRLIELKPADFDHEIAVGNHRIVYFRKGTSQYLSFRQSNCFSRRIGKGVIVNHSRWVNNLHVLERCRLERKNDPRSGKKWIVAWLHVSKHRLFEEITAKSELRCYFHCGAASTRESCFQMEQ